MKIYTNEFNLNQPSVKKVWTPQHSDYGVGIKVTQNGQQIENRLIKVVDGDRELSSDSNDVNGYKIYKMSSGDPNLKTLKVESYKEDTFISTDRDVQVASTYGQFAWHNRLGKTIKVTEISGLCDEGLTMESWGEPVVYLANGTQAYPGVWWNQIQSQNKACWEYVKTEDPEDPELEIDAVIEPSGYVEFEVASRDEEFNYHGCSCIYEETIETKEVNKIAESVLQIQTTDTTVFDRNTVQPATANEIGGVKVGANLSVGEDGTLSAITPIAKINKLGGVMVGNGLSIDNTGLLQCATPIYTIPWSNSAVLSLDIAQFPPGRDSNNPNRYLIYNIPYGASIGTSKYTSIRYNDHTLSSQTGMIKGRLYLAQIHRTNSGEEIMYFMNPTSWSGAPDCAFSYHP